MEALEQLLLKLHSPSNIHPNTTHFPSYTQSVAFLVGSLALPQSSTVSNYFEPDSRLPSPSANSLCLSILPVHFLLCNIPTQHLEPHPHPILFKPNFCITSSTSTAIRDSIVPPSPSVFCLFKPLLFYIPQTSSKNFPFLPKAGQSRDGSLQRRMFDKTCRCICPPARARVFWGREARSEKEWRIRGGLRSPITHSHPQQNPQFPNAPALESIP